MPAGLALGTFSEELGAPFAATWATLRAEGSTLPHLDEAGELASRYAEVAGGDTLVHTDIRDDNLILSPDGRVWICDWNWPVVADAWLDTLLLLISPRGDGLDVEKRLATLRLTRDVPAESVDVVLALVCGYFQHQAGQAVPPTSPHLRDAQRWMGEVTRDWLAERRGWR